MMTCIDNKPFDVALSDLTTQPALYRQIACATICEYPACKYYKHAATPGAPRLLLYGYRIRLSRRGLWQRHGAVTENSRSIRHVPLRNSNSKVFEER